MTKSALSSVDEAPIAMAVSAKPTFNHQGRTVEPRTDKSPNAPCVLKEHWLYPHTNGVCLKQRRLAAERQPTPQSNSLINQLSNEEKIKRYNRLAAAGVIGYNTDIPQTNNTVPTAPVSVATSDPPANCQFATSYNTTVNHPSKEGALTVVAEYPPASSTHKPTLADTACNRHMYGDALLLDDMREVPPVWINVANNNKSSRIMANHMGTARLHAFAPDGSPSCVEIHNVL